MESRILSYFNLKIDYFIAITGFIMIALVIAVFFLSYDYMKMRKKYNEFMTGENARNLEYTIYKRFREIDKLNEGQIDNDKQVAIIYNKIRSHYSKTGIYKYNAFRGEDDLDETEKLSFVLTLLNDELDGFVLNVIHSRVGCHIYLKEIIKGAPDSVLSDEEKESLSMALEK